LQRGVINSDRDGRLLYWVLVENGQERRGVEKLTSEQISYPIAVVERIPKPISFKLWRNCRCANFPADTPSVGGPYGKQKRKGLGAEFVARHRHVIAPVNGHYIAKRRAFTNVMEKDAPAGSLHLEHLTDHR
jgi:hypothetical protein